MIKENKSFGLRKIIKLNYIHSKHRNGKCRWKPTQGRMISQKTLLRLKCSCISQQKSEVMGFHNQTVNQIIIQQKKKKKRNTRTVMSLTNHLPLASINSSPGRLNYPPLLDNFEHKLCPSFQLPSTCLEKLIQLRFQPLAEEIVNVLLAAREMAHCACPPPHPPNH